MVAVVTGAGLGLSNSSRELAGAAGELGQAGFGRADERVTVNAATGNLVIQNRDEFLLGVGEDVGVLRTYNSQGTWDGDNNDNWRVGFYRRLSGLQGTVNASGSITRTDADGLASVYTFSGGKYISKDGSGAFDSLTVSAGVWTWVDGDTGVSERYTESASGSGVYRLDRVTDVNGHTVRVGYDSNGLITTLANWASGAAAASETVTLGYEVATKRLTHTTTTYQNEANQTVTRTRERYEYDSNGRLAAVRTDLSPEDGVMTDGRVYAVKYGYDAGGRVNSVVQTDGTSLTVEYDASGRVSKYTDGLGRATTLTYDTVNRRTSVLDAANQTTVLAYDASNRLLEVSGAMLGGAAFRQSVGYDADGNLSWVKNAAGEQTDFRYDPRGNMTRRTDAAGNVAEQSYDAANRQVSQTLYTVADADGAGTAAVAGEPQKTQYLYEGASTRRLRFSISPEGRVTQHEYNALGQRTSSTVYTGALYTANPAPLLADIVSWAGGLSSVERAAAERKEYGYDLRGQLTLLRTYSTASVNAQTQAVAYGTPAEQRYVYDAFGRLLRSTDATGNSTSYVYDGMDRVTFTQDARNAITLHQYDDAGNRTIVRQSVGGTNQVSVYDRAGQLLSQSEGVAFQPIINRTLSGATTADWTGYTLPASGLGFATATGATLSTGDATVAAARVIAGQRIHRFDSGVLIRARISVPTLAVDQLFTIGADNNGAVPARYHRAAIRDGQLYSQYYDQGGVARELQLSSPSRPLVAGSVYYVDVETTDSGSTLYVHTGDRSTGFVHHTNTNDWGVVRARIASAVSPGRTVQQLNILGVDEWRFAADGSVLFEQSFGPRGGTAGLSNWPASNSLFRLSEGGLVVDTRLAGLSNAEQTVQGDAIYREGDLGAIGKVMFRSEVTTSAVSTGRNFRIGAANTGSGTAARALTARMIGGDLYAEFRNQADGAWTKVLLSSSTKLLKNNQVYVVDVNAEQSGGGATLSVYEKGTSSGAAGSFSYRLNQDVWGDQRFTMTAFGDQASTSALTTVGRMQEVQLNAVATTRRTSFAYDKLGRLRSVLDGTNKRSHVLYDPAGRKVADIDAAGRVSEYVYDAAGRLVQTIEFNNRIGATTLATLTDAGGKPVDVALSTVRPVVDTVNDRVSTRFYDKAGRLAGTQDAAGYLTAMRYDGQSRLTSTVAYATASTITRIATSGGSTTATPPALASAQPTLDAANDRTTRLFYTRDGLLQGTLDADGYLTQTEYDAAGRKIADTQYATVTDATKRSGPLSGLTPAPAGQDRRSIYVYDGAGRLAADLDADGYLTTYGYDLANRQTSQRRYLATSRQTVWYDAAAAAAGQNPAKHTPATGLTVASLIPGDTRNLLTTKAYTPRGELEYEVSASNVSTRYVYDANGRLITISRDSTTADKRDTWYDYDGAGQLKAETNPQSQALAHTYDAAGRRTITKDALGNKTFFYYDEAGKLRYSILQTALGGEVKENVYNAFDEVAKTRAYTKRLSVADTAALTGGLVTTTLNGKIAALADATTDSGGSMLYTKRGEIQQAIDAMSRKTDYVYTAFGQLKTSLVDMDTRRTRTDAVYDRRGNQRSSTVDQGGLNIVTATEYDAFGRVTATVDGLNNRTTTKYYKNDGASGSGRKVEVTDASLAVRTTTYDAMDRVIVSTNALNQATTFQHDDVNRRMTLTTAEGIQTVTEYSRHGQVVKVTDGTLASTTYTYDRNGALLSTTDALGNVTQNTYDAVGNLVKLVTGLKSNAGAAPSNDGSAVTTQYTYDAARRVLTQQIDPTAGLNLTTSYQYDGQGRALKIIDAKGMVTTHAFDAKGQLKESVVDDVPGGLQLRTWYFYDSQGHSLYVTEAGGTAAARTTEYRYDVAGRRTHEVVDPTGLKLTTSYTYDKAGNVVLKRDALGHGTRYVYDSANRLKYTIDATGGVTQRLYDKEGRLTGTKAFVKRLAENHAARIWYQAGNNSSLERSLGTFAAGDVVTATVRFKAEIDEVGGLFVGDAGGAVAYENAVFKVMPGTRDFDGWQTLTVTHTMTHEDPMWVFLYGNRDGATTSGGDSVLYDSLTVSSVAKGVVLTEGFDSGGRIGTDGAWQTSGLAAHSVLSDIALSTATLTDAQIETAVAALGSTGDALSQIAYDRDGRASYVVNAEGAVAQTVYDKAGRVVEVIRYATPFVGTWGPNSVPTLNALKDQHTYTVYDAVGRVRYSVDAHDYVTEQVYDRGGRVVASKQYAKSIVRPSVLSEASVAAALATRLDAVNDRIEYFAYDAAGRQRFSIDAEGYATEQQLDALGRVTSTLRHSNKLSLASAPTLAQAIAATRTTTTFDTNLGTFNGTAGVLENGRLKLVSKPEAGGSWATMSGGRNFAPGASFKFEVTPNQLQQDLHIGVVGNLEPSSRIVALFRPNGRVGAQTYDPVASGYSDMAAYTPGTTYTVEVTTTDTGATLYVYVKGTSRETGAIFRSAGNFTWTSVSTVFYTQRYSTQAGETTAFVDNVEERAAGVSSTRYDAAGRVTHTVDEEGVVTRYAYDAAGRVTEVTEAFGLPEASTTRRVYDVAGHMVEETAGYNTAEVNTTRYRYDANGRMSAKIDPRGVAAAAVTGLSVLDRDLALDKYTTRYGYDALGRQVSVTDPKGGLTTTEYDVFGNAVKVTDARGNSGYFYFDRLNRNTLFVDPDGFVTRNVYDSFGNKTGTTQYANRAVGTWSGWSKPAIVATAGSTPYVLADAARDASVAFEFDRLGQTTRRTDAENVYGTGAKAYETFAYDAFGNRTTWRNKVGGVFNYVFDRRGQVLRETLPITTLNSSDVSIAVVNRNVYDARGNRIRFIEAEGAKEQRITTYRYDAVGRLVESQGEAVNTYQINGGAKSNVVPIAKSVYDARGNMIAEIDANGKRTAYFYDVLDHKVGEVGPTGALSRWTYDAVGNVVNQRLYGDAVSLPVGTALPSPVNAANVRETTYTYDANNREIESRMIGLVLGRQTATGYQAGAANGLDRVVVSKQYDALGNQIKRVDGNGGITYSFYNRASQKILEVDAEGYATAWTYGINGSTTRETKYARRSASTINENSDAAALLAAWPADATDRITDNTYDRAFRLVTESRRNVAYGSVNATSGALTEATAAATKTFAYDGLDKKILEVDANGRQSDWQYDATGRLKRQQLPGFTDFEGAAVRATTDYEYNGLNDVVRTIQRGKDGTVETDDQISRSVYGTGGRLIAQIDAKGQSAFFEHDAIGNVTMKRVDRRDADGVLTSEGMVYGFDAMHREVSREAVTFGAAWAYGDKYETRYNVYGEITGRRTNGGNAAGEWQEFTEYNQLGYVARTNVGSGVAKAYLYDANGNATLSMESAGVDLRGLTLDQMLEQREVFRTISVYDKRNQLLETLQPRMDATRDEADVHQFVAQQVTLSPGGGGQITNSSNLLSTTPSGAAPPPELTQEQRFQPLTSSVDIQTYETIRAYVKVNSVTVNLSAAGIRAQLGAVTGLRVRVSYAISGAFNQSGVNEVLITDANATSATIGLGVEGMWRPVRDLNFTYTVTVMGEYLAAPAVTVASAQFGAAVAWQGSSQVPDGEGGYTAVATQAFAPASALNGSFKTFDLAPFAATAPSADISVWQDKVGAETLSSIVQWYTEIDPNFVALRAIVEVKQVTVNLPTPSIQQTFGGLKAIKVLVDYDLEGDSYGSRTAEANITASGTTSVVVPLDAMYYGPPDQLSFTYNVRVYYTWETTGQDILVATSGAISQALNMSTPSNALDRTFYADISNKTFFSGGTELATADEAYFYYRTMGSLPYTGIKLSRASTVLSDQAADPASPVNGIFYAWNSWIPEGVVDYKIVVMKAGAYTGSFNGNSIAASVGLNSTSRAQTGEIFFDDQPAIHLIDQNTPRLMLQYRRTGSSDGWWQTEVATYKTGGWFSWPWQAAGLSGQYDVRVLRMDAGGTVTSRMFTQMSLHEKPTATPLVPYAEGDIVLNGQPANAETLTFKYRVAGSISAFTTTYFDKRSTGTFGRDFQWDNLLPSVTSSSVVYDYEYEYEARDSGGQVVNGATGIFRVTPNAKTFESHNSVRMPTVVAFTIDDSTALYMDLRYRPVGSSIAYTAEPRLSRASYASQFKWDASAFTPATGSATFEYQYRLYDVEGNPVLNALGTAIVVDGQVTVGETESQAPQSGWVITGSTTTSNIIRRRQSYNAFGEVSSETDGRGNVTNLAYNTLGQLVLRQDPTTDVTGENGVTTRRRPETRFYYDRAGKAVATKDANGFITAQLWNDGLAQAKVLKEFRPEAGNMALNTYDVFGNLRMSQDGVGRQTRYTYDLNNQLTRLDRPTRAAGQHLAGQSSYDLYEYDSSGRRIAVTNVLGRARTYYDRNGRVAKVTTIEGRNTTFDYAYINTILGAGGKQVGGWRTTTTAIGNMVSTDSKDVFNRLTSRRDFGGHVYTYAYNNAGWLTTQSSTLGGIAQQSLSYGYFANGYLKRQTDNVYHLQTNYTYDGNGNRVYEGYRRTDQANAVYANSTITYDELNRVQTVSDPKYLIRYKYDAVGNRRNIRSDYNDGLDGNKQTQDLWYLYDSLNRFTVTMGKLEGGVISRGENGKLIAYNRANERVSAEYESGTGAARKIYHERYVYTSDGYLQDMYLGTWNGTNFVEQTQAASTRNTDLAGRVTNYVERRPDNSIQTNLTRVFDRDNRQMQEIDATSVHNGQSKTDTYEYNADGTLKQIVSSNVQTPITRTFAYQWWDSAKQTELKVQASWAPGVSKLTYDLNGNLHRATDVTGKRTIQYVTDAEGQILFRQELAARTGVGSDWSDATLEAVGGEAERKRSYYYINGHRIGDVNNESQAPSTTDYAEALAQTRNASNDEANKKFTPTAHANFDENYQPINAAYPGSTPTDYTVNEGDTLQSIAARIWGDRAMWYLIADANGLSGVEKLSAGTRLTIPNKVANIHNNSSTFQVYDAGEAIGNVSPTMPAPPPPPDKGCGGLGAIIMIVIAIVVTIYTAGAATALIAGALNATAGSALAVVAGAAGGAIGGAVGSIASQGFAVAVGMQDKMNWRSVGQAALSGAITGGIGASGFGEAVKSMAVASNLGAYSTTIVNVASATLATGMQLAVRGKWNWRQVAGAAISGAFGGGPADTSSVLGMAATIGGRFIGNALSNKVTEHSWNSRSAWVNAVGSSLGDGIDVVGKVRQRGQEFGGEILETLRSFSATDNSKSAFGGAGGESTTADVSSGGTIHPMKIKPGMAENFYPTKFNDTSGSIFDDLSFRMKVFGLSAGDEFKLPNQEYATVRSGDTVEGVSGGDKELMGRYIQGMQLRNPNVLSAGRKWVANWDMSANQAVALANRFYTADANSKRAAAESAAEAQAATAAASISPGMCRPPEVGSYEWRLTATPAELRYLEQIKNGPQMTQWDGVSRGSPAEEYLKKAGGGLGAVRGDSFHYRAALSVQDAAVQEIGGAAVGYGLRLAGAGWTASRGVLLSERSILLSDLKAEMQFGLRADLRAPAAMSLVEGDSIGGALAMLPPPPKGTIQRVVDSVIRGNGNHVAKYWGDLNANEYGAIRNYMSRTEAGQKVVEAVDRRSIFLQFTDDLPPSPSLIGVSRGLTAKVYLRNTEGGNLYSLVGRQADPLEFTANVGLHEGLHSLGVAGSRRAEALVRLEELRSMGVGIDRNAMRQVLTDMKGNYNQLTWRAGRTTPSFPGLQF